MAKSHAELERVASARELQSMAGRAASSSQKFEAPSEKMPWRAVAILTAAQVGQGINFTLPLSLLVYMVRDFPMSEGKSEGEIGQMAGLAGSAFMFASLPTAYALGAASDRVGRRPITVLALVSVAASLIGVGFAQSYAFALSWRVVGGLLNALPGTIKTVLGELCPGPLRAQGFSYLSMGWGLGTAAGPLIAGALARPCEDGGFLAGVSGACGEGSLLNGRPYLLPHLVGGGYVLLCAVMWRFFVPETLPRLCATAEAGGSSNGEER
eukprot:CAMPEP_0170133886 /NCGR_PEP_ID=MMETSP0033_2-20121228/1596_1 /TAXON_ID=195969 /ORGANISM="Dolichomastix tenuilepis, Strain CCMP3274" /LENGTH=267 /DNA_ID=CAMNT_0010369421 /DNA_START=62 /DNA_END=862 /DNA_ORIENTATION=-